jgi:hypothetical protein
VGWGVKVRCALHLIAVLRSMVGLTVLPSLVPIGKEAGCTLEPVQMLRTCWKLSPGLQDCLLSVTLSTGISWLFHIVDSFASVRVYIYIYIYIYIISTWRYLSIHTNIFTYNLHNYNYMFQHCHLQEFFVLYKHKQKHHAYISYRLLGVAVDPRWLHSESITIVYFCATYSVITR